MENFGIINVWIEHYYFLTGTLENTFFWQEFCYRNKKKDKDMLEKHPLKIFSYLP